MQNQCSWLSRIVKTKSSLVFFLLLVSLLCSGYWLYYLPDITSPSAKWPLPIYIYTREGELIAEFGHRRHQAVKMEEVPLLLRQAFFATEDKRFLEHYGVDVHALLRAGIKLLTTGRKLQGGSTITMQMARNYYLSHEKTFLRKLREIVLAIKIERTFSKEQILELYFNKIYMGHRTFGIGAAAKFYFQKPLDQLSLAQMALLAGIPQAPAFLNPIANTKAAKKRRDFVLYRLRRLDFINQEDYQSALAEEITPSPLDESKPSLLAPYAADIAKEAAKQILGKSATDGYHVYTTIDSRAQCLAEEAMTTSLLEYDQRHGYRCPEKRLGSLKSSDIGKVLMLLKKTPMINELEPAVVISCDNQRITALTRMNALATIERSEWSWIIKGKQTSLAHYIKVGDVIRIYQKDDIWRLGQIPKVQGAIVALDPLNGGIKAMSGGFSYALSQFNRTTQAMRQTGSSFKPFIYAAGFEKGYNLSDVFNDAPLIFDIPGKTSPWRPQNVNQSFYGLTRLRVALITSANLVTIRLLQAIGIPYVLKMLKRFGFDTRKWPKNLSLALGSIEATPLEMARGYAVFANGGYLVNPYIIDHITDYKGHLVYQANPLKAPSHEQEKSQSSGKGEVVSSSVKVLHAPKVVSDEVIFLVTSALQGVIPYSGLPIAKSLDRFDLAGKTGTTNDTVDSWFIGYHLNDWVASVWVGYDQRQPLNEYAYTTALPFWIRFMKPVLQGISEKKFEKPSGISILPIDPETGLPAERASRDTLYEYFQTDTLDRYKSSTDIKQPAQSSQEPLF